jgi:autotransporter passenger strand-loop-strand repeat protein
MSTNVQVASGQTYTVSSGQIDTGDTVDGGGTINVFLGGETSGTVVYSFYDLNAPPPYREDIGTQVVSGGVAIGTFVEGGLEYVEAGGTEIGATLTIYYSYYYSNGITYGPVGFAGRQLIVSGGTAIETSVGQQATQEIEAGGVALYTNDGGVEYVDSGGEAAFGTVTGTEYVGGTTLFTTVEAGQLFETAAFASGTIVLGGTEYVEDGGTAFGTQVSAGTQIVSAAIANSTQVFGGEQIVSAP